MCEYKTKKTNLLFFLPPSKTAASGKDLQTHSFLAQIAGKLVSDIAALLSAVE